MQHQRVYIRLPLPLGMALPQIRQRRPHRRMDLLRYRAGSIIRHIIRILARRLRELRLEEQLRARDLVLGDGARNAGADEVFAVVARLRGCVDGGEVVAQGEVHEGGCGFFFPGCAVEEGGEGVGC